MDISTNLNKFTKVLNEKHVIDFLLLQIPSFNQNEILNNSILGHEIGHYIEEKLKLSVDLINLMIEQRILTKEKIDSLIKEKFDRERTYDKDLEYTDFLLEEFHKWVYDKIISWMKEIVSDIIGLKIFGLAFFFATVEAFSLTQSTGGKEHSPTYLRVKYLIEDIKNTIINPGLELTNVGEVPISLFPGIRIAQISFHKCDFHNENFPKPEKYFGSTGPSFSEIYKDRDLFIIERELDQNKLNKKINLLISILESDFSQDISVFFSELKKIINLSFVNL